ncbi:hypothetical protein CRE_02724 [Caenorhabditis remanei]|uniref:BZIP domain-containing protein n=1 Tax=Caenorhabditis remanei TaxID=31234 RepID=E3NPP9_CAERE|nr:hypothetical protein CRE_02724 [Caenorhabditis remanei]
MSENPQKPLADKILSEKNLTYAERRRRNNEAARKSRKARMEQEIANAKKGIQKEKKYKHIKAFQPSCSQEYRLAHKNNF